MDQEAGRSLNCGQNQARPGLAAILASGIGFMVPKVAVMDDVAWLGLSP